MLINIKKQEQGGMLIYLIIIICIFSILMLPLLDIIVLKINILRSSIDRERALQIAEAGVNYYQWHLAHFPSDYQDGTGSPGPYVHDYVDYDTQQSVGKFSLVITPPATGSTIVTIQATGWTNGSPSMTRTITVQYGIPSWAKYAVVANCDIRFGAGTEIFGPLRSNGGIRFDGLAHNVVSSARSTYDDPDDTGPDEFGVHTHISPVDPLPPNPVPSRPDVFKAGRQFPVPALDFAGITSDLSQMKVNAMADGFYRAGSGKLAYHIVLKTNDTFDLYKVTKFINPPSGCSSSQTGWSSWSISTQTLIGNYPFPENGLIFLEDNIFVDGQINTARLTIAAATFPDSGRNIIINNDLKYTNYDGQDVIALIAQGNINVGLVSEDDLQIDAALVAQNGRVGRHYYNSNCGFNYIRDTITLYGMIATSQRYGFAYTDGTGYQTRDINYDGNILYSPPPSFPLTTEGYKQLNWASN